MSSGRNLTSSFFAPLMGRTTTFLAESREVNLALASVLMGQIAASGCTCAILDLDALYSCNSGRIFRSVGKEALDGIVTRVPQPGTDLEAEIAGLFAVQQDIVIVDSLNSLYHMLAQEDASSRGRKLAFAISGLSYFARTNAKSVILSMYRREGLLRGAQSRPISGLTDNTVTVEPKGPEMIFLNERGQRWPEGRFSIRTPSG